MATFTGTTKEFHDFIGPRIRNVINNFTRKSRLSRNGVCEFCGQKAELQSAHVHGRDRRTIIETVLMPYSDENGLIKCIIESVEKEILQAHEPIGKTFKFICHPCHVEYDSSNTRNSDSFNTGRQQTTPITPEFTKISKIRLWASRPHQINSRIIKAFLKTEENGETSYALLKKTCEEEFSIEGFESHFASMKTDKGNSHGAVFYEVGNNVRIWDRVRSEIETYFQ